MTKVWITVQYYTVFRQDITSFWDYHNNIVCWREILHILQNHMSYSYYNNSVWKLDFIEYLIVCGPQYYIFNLDIILLLIIVHSLDIMISHCNFS